MVCKCREQVLRDSELVRLITRQFHIERAIRYNDCSFVWGTRRSYRKSTNAHVFAVFFPVIR